MQTPVRVNGDTQMIDFTLTDDTLSVPWDEVTRILGREHSGSPEDDDHLVAALLMAGAPTWIGDAGGSLDESGWNVHRP